MCTRDGAWQDDSEKTTSLRVIWTPNNHFSDEETVAVHGDASLAKGESGSLFLRHPVRRSALCGLLLALDDVLTAAAAAVKDRILTFPMAPPSHHVAIDRQHHCLIPHSGHCRLHRATTRMG